MERGEKKMCKIFEKILCFVGIHKYEVVSKQPTTKLRETFQVISIGAPVKVPPARLWERELWEHKCSRCSYSKQEIVKTRQIY